jgi:hypothetical protein
MMDAGALVKEYASYVRSWEQSYFIWLIIGYSLGVLSIFASVSVASAPPFITKRVDTKTLGFITAILTALSLFLDPMGRADSYGSATALVWPALAKVELAGPDEIKSAELELVKTAADATTSIHAKAVARHPPTNSK